MSSVPLRPPFISTHTSEGRYLFLDLKPARRRTLAPVCAGREVCTPEYRIDRRGFEHHVVEFVVGGKWTLWLRGRRHELRPGALFAYGPGVPHRLEAADGGERVKYFVSFGGSAAHSWMDLAGLGEGAVLYAGHPRWIHDLFDQLIECAHLGSEEARELAGRLLELILWRVRSDAEPGPSGSPDSRRTFVRCRAFIQEHYLELNSIEETARRCGVDPAYLARLFARHGGERPLQFLTRLKTNHAADLILRQGQTVAQAGQAVGFPDPYHFSRVFKRVHGVPPGSLRGR